MIKFEYYLKSISYSIMAMILTIILMPVIDHLSFLIFNGHLLLTNRVYQFIFGALNHPLENHANLIFFLISLCYGAIIRTHHKKNTFFFILGAIVFFEIFFRLFVILDKSALLLRASPSCYFTYLDLRSIFPEFPIKVNVLSSFPSGHAMAAAYWASLAQTIYDSKYQNTIFLISIFMCIPRLVSGAHWFSDVWVGFIIGQELFNFYQFLVSYALNALKPLIHDFCFFYKKNIKYLIKN